MKQNKKSARGQSTIEYILMVAFGALFSIQMVAFFNGIFREGLTDLERNVSREVATGVRFQP
ncbi:MAG: hypothetical protein HY537_12180 [Deltaproteobacteria bacterium]|nr:hypothetical protein [Deltaproteobacteria bacterium]